VSSIKCDRCWHLD